MFLLVPAHPGRPGQRAVKRSCVCGCFSTKVGYIGDKVLGGDIVPTG